MEYANLTSGNDIKIWGEKLGLKLQCKNPIQPIENTCQVVQWFSWGFVTDMICTVLLNTTNTGDYVRDLIAILNKCVFCEILMGIKH